jgi:RND family efflux transporter MFP subunit
MAGRLSHDHLGAIFSDAFYFIVAPDHVTSDVVLPEHGSPRGLESMYNNAHVNQPPAFGQNRPNERLAEKGDDLAMRRFLTSARGKVHRAVASAGLIALLAGCDGSGNVDPDDVTPALTVTTILVTEREIRRSVVATGTIVPWQDLSIGTEISGLKVIDVPVDEGDIVKSGQLLAQIDKTVVSAQLRHAEAVVKEAEANLKYALTDSERAKELIARGNISPQTAEDRETKALAAEARLAMAQAERDQMLARVVASSVVAPDDGYISKRSVLIGDVVTAGRELFRMVRDGRLELNAEVPETDIGFISEGQQVRVLRDHLGPILGAVRLVGPIVDPQTRLGTVHVALPENSGLKPGMFARAEIMTSRAVSTAIPEASLVWRNDEANVFVITEKDHVELREIETGGRQDGWVEVVSGLTTGDQVVDTGAGFLHDGDRVLIHRADVRSASTGME